MAFTGTWIGAGGSFNMANIFHSLLPFVVYIILYNGMQLWFSSAITVHVICTLAISLLASLGALARAEVFSNCTHRKETRVTGKDGKSTVVSSETEAVSSR